MTLRLAGLADGGLLSALQAPCFPEDPWPAEAMTALLESPGVYGLIAGTGEVDAGFILCRAVVDEAEVLTLAVAPARRHRGAGGLLLGGGLAWAAALGVTRMVLEVAEDNHPALALYGRAGFTAAGRRPGYYRRGSGLIAALILARPLEFPDREINPSPP